MALEKIVFTSKKKHDIFSSFMPKHLNYRYTLQMPQNKELKNCIILKYGIVSANIAEIDRSILLKKLHY